MTDRYAVVGNPISHSQSPLIHRAFARQTDQAMDYGAIEAPLGGFAAAAEAFRLSGGRGLNVTAPFKIDAFEYTARVSDRAACAGAVNALRFDGAISEGENFDGVGLVRDITMNIGRPIAGRRVLLLGAGGAARGVLSPLLAEKPASIFVVNRTADTARALARRFRDEGPVNAGEFADLGDLAFDVAINALSSSATDGLPPPGALRACALAYDLTYGRGLTPFLARAREDGVENIADGAGMLVEQAAEAFAWWRGVRPETAAVLALLTVALV